MADERNPELLAQDLQALQSIDEVVDRFDRAWQTEACPPRIEDYLVTALGEQRLQLLRELVMVDLEYRIKAGCPRALDQYAREFPELAQTGGSFDPEICEFDRRIRNRVGSPKADEPATVAVAWVPTPSTGARGSGDTVEAVKKAKAGVGIGEDESIAGKYRCVARLGQGGQAEVYRAVDAALSRDVVIKISRRTLADNSCKVSDQLLSEGRILAALRHVNLAHVYDCGMYRNRPYLVMEYVPGADLQQYTQFHTMTVRGAAGLVAQIASALAAVHHQNILHLDLKPSNILIDEQGQPRLIDFGLGELRDFWSDGPSCEGGTPAYISPEQARSERDRIGPAADIFGAGAILYFLLTKKAPFAAKSPLDSLARAAACQFDREALASAHVPRRLGAICLKAMAAEPADRYPTAEALCGELSRFSRPSHKRFGALGLIPLLLLATTVWWISRHDPPVPQPSPQRPDQQLADELVDQQFVDQQLVDQQLVEVIQRTENGHERIYTPKTLMELQQLNPLKAGDRLQFSFDTPADCQVATFWVDVQGRLREVPSRQVTSGDVSASYLCPAEGVWSVSGQAGTVLFLVCASRGRKPLMVDVQQALAQGSRSQVWPQLPASVLLELRRQEVVPIGEVPREIIDTPLSTVRDYLENLRQELNGKHDFFCGVALPQE